MSQHFLLSAKAQTLSLAAVLRMSDQEAEAAFVRIRWAEIGHHHHIAGAYLVRYAQEAAWREDHRRVADGAQVQGVMWLAMACRPSVDWCGYWQRGQR